MIYPFTNVNHRMDICHSAFTERSRNIARRQSPFSWMPEFALLIIKFYNICIIRPLIMLTNNVFYNSVLFLGNKCFITPKLKNLNVYRKCLLENKMYNNQCYIRQWFLPFLLTESSSRDIRSFTIWMRKRVCRIWYCTTRQYH